MIVSLINWIYIFAISVILGGFLLPRFVRLIDKDSKPVFNFCDYVVAGLVTCTVYAQLYSLFGGVSVLANVILAVTCVVLLIIDRKNLSALYQNHVKSIKGEKLPGEKVRLVILTAVAVILFAVNLMYTAEGTFHYDTGLYHAQAIHWLEDYGIVKGLGHMHVRLAYNSAYFPLCALFSMREVFGQSLHSVSGFVSALMCCYSVYGWNKSLKDKTFLKQSAISDMIRLAPLFYFLVCMLEITSPESDYITVYLIIFIILRLVEVFEKESEDKKSHLAGYCLLAVCSFALVGYKLSAAVIAVVTVWPLIVMIKKKKWAGIAVCAILCILVVVPYLIRNVIICGWLVYPVDAIDLFNVSWKFDKSTLSGDAAEIGQWAKSLDKVEGGFSTTFGWIGFWWQEQYLATKLFVASMLMSLPVMIVTFFDRKKWFVKYLMVILASSVVFYMIKAPLIRYCYGPVLIIPLMTAGYLLAKAAGAKDKSVDNKSSWFESRLGLLLAGVLTIVIIAPSLYSTTQIMKFNYQESAGRFNFGNYIVKQVDYPEPEVFGFDWYGQKVYLPLEGDQCWYFAFPSSPYFETFENVRPVTGDFKDGFEKIK